MARKRPKFNLNQPIQPRTGDLSQLFETEEDVEQASGLQLLAIRVDAIQADPDQPRNTFPAESLQELSESIQQDGVIQPIEVTQIRPNVFMIVHGERRWRAARLAGLETIPAVVRRRDYDQVTRFVRQVVENIQREDLNDVDRAGALLRLRDLLQEELNAFQANDDSSDKPWNTKVSWAKVGGRLGYSRQRIHQLIKLLDLPEEIKTAVREGSLTERDTRIYQGLKPSQQRALHKARMAGDIEGADVGKVARLLKESPDLTTHKAIRLLANPQTTHNPPTSTGSGSQTAAPGPTPSPLIPPPEDGTPLSNIPMSIQRIRWARHHLSLFNQATLNANDRQEAARLLALLQQDIESLLEILDES